MSSSQKDVKIMEYNALKKGNCELLGRARALRNNATQQENHLWHAYLKHCPVRWHRQRVIGNFIVDFYCPKAMFVVELDGMHHSTPQQKSYDDERSAYLTALGLLVLRFQNHEVDEQFHNVRKRIESLTASRLQAFGLLPPEGAVAPGD